MMKINYIIMLTLISVITLNCSGMRVNYINVASELRSEADFIKKDKQNVYSLDRKVIGNKGYFYIIDGDGKILYHPKKALINYDFSSYAFIQKILKQRNGCLASDADGRWRYIFFREINSGEILCLTIESNEFDENINECYIESEGKP